MKISFATQKDWATGTEMEIGYIDSQCCDCGRVNRFAFNRRDPLTISNELDAVEKRYDRLFQEYLKMKEQRDACMASMNIFRRAAHGEGDE